MVEFLLALEKETEGLKWQVKPVVIVIDEANALKQMSNQHVFSF